MMNIKREFDNLENTDGWEDLFEDLKFQSNFSYSFTIAQMPQNRERNRYNNVLPYDHNRIRLNPPSSLYKTQSCSNNLNSQPTLYNIRHNSHRNFSNKSLRSRWFRRNISSNSQGSSGKICKNIFKNQNNNSSPNIYNDYINASLLPISLPPGTNIPNSSETDGSVEHLSKNSTYYYILTQGPLSHTASHFWYMIWQYKTRCIIMLNKIYEMGALKCHPYYPGALNQQNKFGNTKDFNVHYDSDPQPTQNSSAEEDDSFEEEYFTPEVPCIVSDDLGSAINNNSHHPIIKNSSQKSQPSNIKKRVNLLQLQLTLSDVGLQINTLKRETNKDFTITLFELKELKTGLRREVYHFQYTAWPDFGVPKDPLSFLRFLTRIRTIVPAQNKILFSGTEEDTQKAPTKLQKLNKTSSQINDLASSSSKDTIKMTINNLATMIQTTVNNYPCPSALSSFTHVQPCPSAPPSNDTNLPTNSGGKDEALPGTYPVQTTLDKTSMAVQPDNIPDNVPIVIHCSAGIGRTGTYCLIDYVLNLLNINDIPTTTTSSSSPKPSTTPADSKINVDKVLQQQSDAAASPKQFTNCNTYIDIPEILCGMRKYRAGLVQTPDQLRFAYLVILTAMRIHGLLNNEESKNNSSNNNYLNEGDENHPVTSKSHLFQNPSADQHAWFGTSMNHPLESANANAFNATIFRDISGNEDPNTTKIDDCDDDDFPHCDIVENKIPRLKISPLCNNKKSTRTVEDNDRFQQPTVSSSFATVSSLGDQNFGSSYKDNFTNPSTAKETVANNTTPTFGFNDVHGFGGQVAPNKISTIKDDTDTTERFKGNVKTFPTSNPSASYINISSSSGTGGTNILGSNNSEESTNFLNNSNTLNIVNNNKSASNSSSSGFILHMETTL